MNFWIHHSIYRDWPMPS